MAQTVADLVELGLSEAEAKRVINRKEKAEAKTATSIALAKKRLPKIEEDLAHAKARVEHWTEQAKVLEEKADKYHAVIDGTSTESGEEPAESSEAQQIAEAQAEAKPKATRSRAKK